MLQLPSELTKEKLYLLGVGYIELL